MASSPLSTSSTDTPIARGKGASNAVVKVASGAARYSWNDDPNKSLVLITLVTAAFARKPADKRYMRSSEWETLFHTFNREASAPVDTVKILHNRLAMLRQHCKDYHAVVQAQQRGDLETEDDWQSLLRAQPALRKWRKRPFEFYEEMKTCLRVQGELLDGDEGGTADTNAAVAEIVNRRRQREEDEPMEDTSAEPARNVKPKREKPVVEWSSSARLYKDALAQLDAMGLNLEDRVDAKRFLVEEKNARTFVHMDEEEQSLFLSLYCFDQRPNRRRTMDM